MNRPGRKPNINKYVNITYEDKLYTIGSICYNDDYKYFIIDTDEFVKINGITMHIVSTSYVSHSVYIENDKKELYLHNLIMNRYGFPGKGVTETVDHINRNPLDNRKENLRVITQTEQNLNQKKKERKIELPQGCDITVEDIPKHVWYMKSDSTHGDRFVIEMKSENIIWKSRSSKKISLKEKLQETKAKLREYYEIYPYLNPDNEDTIELINSLTNSYNEIVEKSKELFE